MATLTVTPENVTAHSFNTPPEPAALVGSDVWDDDTASYSFSSATYTAPATYRFAYMTGDIPTAAISVATAGTLTGLSAHLVAKYDDDADALASPSLSIIMGDFDGGSPNVVSLVRQDASAFGFTIDDGNTAMTAYTSSSWVLTNTTTTASTEDIATALTEGVISVRSPLIASLGSPFTTRAWVYELTLTLTYDAPEPVSGGIPPRRLRQRSDGKGMSSAPRLFGNR